MIRHRFEVGPADAERRLDAWIAERIDLPLSRSQVQSEIKKGTITVNSRGRAASYQLRAGDIVEFEQAAEPASSELGPSSIPLNIVFEDQHLIVLDKPAGLVVHPAPGHETETLANALLAHCGPGIADVGGVARCGIVHRLDKLTSGLMLVAKTPAAHQTLTKDLADRIIQRRYLALAVGHFKESEGAIDQPIGRRPRDRKRMGIVRDGRAAKTSYRVLLEAHAMTLLLARLHTGRTHQIRVHLQAVGHPVLGDEIYGWTKKRVLMAISHELRNPLAANWPDRQMLHAAGIKFRHPATEKLLEFISPIPADMNLILGLIFGDAASSALEKLRDDLAVNVEA